MEEFKSVSSYDIDLLAAVSLNFNTNSMDVRVKLIILDGLNAAASLWSFWSMVINIGQV